MSRKQFYTVCILVVISIVFLGVAVVRATDVPTSDAVYGGLVNAPGGATSLWRTSFSIVNGSIQTGHYEFVDLYSKKVVFQFDLPGNTLASTNDLIGLIGLAEGAYSLRFRSYNDNPLTTALVLKTYNSGAPGTPGVALKALVPLTLGSRYLLFDKTGDFRNKVYVITTGYVKYKIEFYNLSSLKIGEVIDDTAVEKFIYYTPPASASFCRVTITEILIGCPSPCADQSSELYTYVTAVDNIIGTPVIIQ